MKPSPSSPSRFSLGTTTSVNGELGGVLGVQPDLVEVATALEALHAALDDQQADALVAGLGVGARDHDDQVCVDAVADEGLGPVQQVVVALVDGGGAHALQVAARAGLGHRDRGDRLAGHAPGQPAPLLLVGADAGDVGNDDVGVHGEPGAARAGAGLLVGEDHVVAEVGDPRAVVLLRDVEAQQPRLARLEPQLAGDDPVLLPLVVERDDLPLVERPRGLAEVLVLGGVEVGHGGPFDGEKIVTN